MDLRARVEGLIQALAGGDPIVAEDVTLPDPGNYTLLDVLPRRNLVFASWQRDDGATGTWVLSFDRDGRVTHWTSL